MYNNSWRQYEQSGRPGPMRQRLLPPPSTCWRFSEYAPYNQSHPNAPPFETSQASPLPSNAWYPISNREYIWHADASHETEHNIRNSPRDEHQWASNNNDTEHFVDVLHIDAQISAQKIKLRWNLGAGHIRYFITWTEDNRSRHCKHDWKQTQRTFKTTPGQTYKVIVEARGFNDQIYARAEKEYKAVFSLDEQDKLYKKAVNLVGPITQNRHRFFNLYRCNPWDNIERTNRTIKKYTKDNSGQPANHINGAVTGLILSASLSYDDELRPQGRSEDHRMTIRAEKLLNSDEYNFYFGDLYCNRHETEMHYVTIVVCRKESPADLHCQLKVKRLPQDNPFLNVEKVFDPVDGQPYYQFSVNLSVWVDIFYTEDIPLAWGHLDSIATIGIGKSHNGGLSKNTNCLTYNLYPQRSGSDENEILDAHNDAPNGLEAKIC